MSDPKDVWQVRYVHPEVRKQLRLYATQNDITIAQALKELVELALASIEEKKL